MNKSPVRFVLSPCTSTTHENGSPARFSTRGKTRNTSSQTAPVTIAMEQVDGAITTPMSLASVQGQTVPHAGRWDKKR